MMIVMTYIDGGHEISENAGNLVRCDGEGAEEGVRGDEAKRRRRRRLN